MNSQCNSKLVGIIIVFIPTYVPGSRHIDEGMMESPAEGKIFFYHSIMTSYY